MIKTILKQIKQYKTATILTPICTCLEVFFEILIPYVIAWLIDYGINEGNISNVLKYGGIMLILAVGGLLAGIGSGTFGAKASTGLAANLREAMYENIQTFSFSNIDRYSTAGLITRMTTDVTNVQNAFQMCLRIAIRAPLTMVISIVMCFTINVKLSCVFVCVLVVLGVILGLIMSRTMPIFEEVFTRYDDLNASVQENVSAIRVVKSFVREDYEKEKFSKASDTVCRLFKKAESILACNNPIMMLCVYGCMMSIAWFGAHYIAVGDMTTGNLTSLLSYVMSMLSSLMMLSMIFVMLSMATASVRRIAQVLNEQADLTNPEQPIETVPNGEIDFDHVSFSYREGTGDYTLHDIDLHIKSGETIGVIGSTGSGKTSFTSLLSRLYDVKEGSVSIGGIDVRKYDMEVLRHNVAVVLQKNVLFSGTILENLRWGKEDATLEECRQACQKACADEFIEQMPDKYDTMIEQGGTNVSGGQRQRLCIARALLSDPKILVLDDSTSAVDTATDAKIKQAFAENLKDTTVIIVSQRISSIEKADRIIVLDEGTINGFDTHENLLKTNDIYKEIYAVQSEGSGDFDHAAESHSTEV